MPALRKLIQITAALLCLGAAAAILRDNGLPTISSSTGLARQTRPPTIGTAAPRFTLPTQGSEIFTLGAVPGATIVNFWATWCQPCRAEMTALQTLVNTGANSPRVIAVNLGESFEAVRQWVEELGLTYTVLLDPQLAVAALYGARGLPTTYLLDSQLMLKRVYYGPVSAAKLLRDIDDVVKTS